VAGQKIQQVVLEYVDTVGEAACLSERETEGDFADPRVGDPNRNLLVYGFESDVGIRAEVKENEPVQVGLELRNFREAEIPVTHFEPFSCANI